MALTTRVTDALLRVKSVDLPILISQQHIDFTRNIALEATQCFHFRMTFCYQKQLLQLSKKELLILDDWGLEKLTPRQSSDLLEVMEDRYQRGSTIIISQLPVGEWYKLVGNPTVADALMDRLLHNGHRVELRGESMRKLAQTDQTS